jgi:hypothetical protein
MPLATGGRDRVALRDFDNLAQRRVTTTRQRPARYEPYLVPDATRCEPVGELAARCVRSLKLSQNISAEFKFDGGADADDAFGRGVRD